MHEVIYSGGWAHYPASAAPIRIRRVLVANRGEIAVRVFRSAQRLGIETVAIFSDPDRDSVHAEAADVAVSIGGTTSAESYLDVAKVLEAAKRTAADAIHPGYGFLSENADFAQAVVDAGLTWIGSTPESIRQMALKVEAKRIAKAAGVPLVPGAELAESVSDAELIEIAQTVGYPLLVKASAGGGGKGMRLVADPDALLQAVETARREALNSFADSTVFFERYLTGARHVEVQVFGDTHGNVVHMFERECSIQRRHQKIVEESPSPGATAATREGLYAAATALAREIGYVGAGTVEFLVFGEGESQEYFFLEMNTRLQVEHPVTESVTGLDLVEWQLRVADGQQLPQSQDQLHQNGHAIEVRLYAEDPAHDYLPSIGALEIFELPNDAFYCRSDLSVWQGRVVSPFYDPMLGKIIASATDRQGAAAGLSGWLRSLKIAGVTTNRDSLIAILESAAFRSGDTTTDFLDRYPELLSKQVVPDEQVDEFAQVAALALALPDHHGDNAPDWLGMAPVGYRNIRAVPQRTDLTDSSGRQRTVVYEFDQIDSGRIEVRSFEPAAGWTGAVAGATFRVSDQDDPLGLTVAFDGVQRRYQITRAGQWIVVGSARDALAFRIESRFPEAGSLAVEGACEAPVPGTVVAVEVAEGDDVSEGQTLVVMEAMKMEHRIVAQTAGRVDELRVAVGQSVDAHEVLAVVSAGQ